MSEAETYGLDGINVDFEKVSQDAGQDYIQFIRELSVECRSRGLVLSVDNYVPRNFNAIMNEGTGRDGRLCDYHGI